MMVDTESDGVGTADAIIVPMTVTTDEVVAALNWSIRQVHHASYTLGRDRISRHIADQMAAEYRVHANALSEMLKSVLASEGAK